MAKHDCNATCNCLNQFIKREEKEGTKVGESEWERGGENGGERVSSPHVSDSPMDDLLRALSSGVIGRHVGSKCGNESIREGQITPDLCGQQFPERSGRQGAAKANAGRKEE